MKANHQAVFTDAAKNYMCTRFLKRHEKIAWKYQGKSKI